MTILLYIALACLIIAAFPKLAELIGANIRWEWLAAAVLLVAFYLL